jgi:hypothetical protein
VNAMTWKVVRALPNHNCPNSKRADRRASPSRPSGGTLSISASLRSRATSLSACACNKSQLVPGNSPTRHPFANPRKVPTPAGRVRRFSPRRARRSGCD